MGNIAIFRVNYKSDFVLTLNSDAGWMTPFCIKFWTGAPSQAYFVGWDGTTYTNCAPVAGEPTKLLVQFDDHHLPVGELKFQIGYHFTIADFPNDTEDEVLNQERVIIEKDGHNEKVMLDFNGETAPDIQFSLPAYANEAQRIANEQQRIENEQQRIDNEQQRIDNEQTRQRNEGTRIENEQQRVQEFGQMKGDLEQATRDAAAAAENANEKGVYAKNQGDYAKQQGDYAKQQGDIAQADHERAEEDHRIAGEDHTQAGSDHTRAGEDHTQAGSDHTRADEDHTQAGNDHTRADQDHTRAESDHAAVEVYVDSLGAFDISAYHATGGVLATYANLQAALGTNGANIPDALRKGGMSVKFVQGTVQSSDNNYVQARLMADEFTTDISAWQGVDAEPAAGSKNLVESGGVAKINLVPLLQHNGDIIDLLSSYENGTIVNGEDVSSNTRVRTSGFFTLSQKEHYFVGLKAPEGFEFRLNIYDLNGTYIGQFDNIWNTFKILKNIDYSNKYRLILRKSDDAAITYADVTTPTFCVYHLNDFDDKILNGGKSPIDNGAIFDNNTAICKVINEETSYLPLYMVFEQGSINNETEVDSDTRIRTAFCSLDFDVKISVPTGFAVSAIIYNENKQRTSSIPMSSTDFTISSVTGSYFRLIVKKQNDSAIIPSDGDAVGVAAVINVAKKSLWETDYLYKSMKASNQLMSIDTAFVLGGINSSGAEVANSARIRTDYISISDILSANKECRLFVPDGYKIILFMFDGSKNILYNTGWSTEHTISTNKAAYMRIVMGKSDDADLSHEQYPSYLYANKYDALDKLAASIQKVGNFNVSFELGSIDGTGADTPSSTRGRTSYIANANPNNGIINIIVPTGCEMIAYCYDANKTFLYHSGWHSGVINVYGTVPFIRFLIRKNNTINVETLSITSIDYYSEPAGTYTKHTTPGILYPTYNYFNYETRKLTHTNLYSAWCQDKCFMHNGVMYILYNEGVSHGLPNSVMCIKSYDFGHTFTEPEVFYSDEGKNVSAWGAGADENGIYIVIRLRTGNNFETGNVVHKFRYLLDGSTEWGERIINLENSQGLQPGELSSFGKLPDGSIAFGVSYWDNISNIVYGGAIVKSNDLFETYTKYDIISESETGFFDPMICVANDIVYGTIRSQSASVPAKFWVSRDSCETFEVYDMPIWNATDILPLRYVNGKIVSFSTNRNLGNNRILYYEIAESKLRTLESGDVPDFDVYNIGHVTQYNQGASGCGVGSGIVVGNWIYWFYGSESSYNLMPDIYMTKMFVEPAKDYTEPLNVYIPN